MSKQKLFLILISVFSIFKLIAQNKPDQLLKVVPPSPGVAALGKYGEIPVGLYTGVPNISIPLYEIKDGSLDLPISLSYHAGGIKVEEIASSVGLGWTLNAGGVLGRNVRGLPDEIDPWQQPAADRIDTIMLKGTDRINKLVKDVQSGDVDGEADMYYFNFNNYSGKFIYDQAGNVHISPNKNLKIEPYPYGWKVVVEDGTVYYFTKSETVSSSDCSNEQIVTSAWYLTRITSSNGTREINFTYEPVAYTYQTLTGQTKYFPISVSGNACLSSPLPCRGNQHYNTQRLVRIDFSEGFIKYNYNKVRSDLVDDKSLDLMEVYSKENVLVKKFIFSYSYFGSNTDGVNRLTENKKRLKLTSITEASLTTQKPPFTFEYNETTELPERLSFAQDHWGYYNGRLNNQDLIASFSTVVSSGDVVFVPGADRKTDTTMAQAGILKKIVYPTGGETIFTYESNMISDDRVESDYREELLVFSAMKKENELPAPYESLSLEVPQGGSRVSFQVTGLSNDLWQGCDFVQCQVIKDNNPVPFRTIGNNYNGATDQWPAGTYKLRLLSDCSMDAIADFRVIITASILVTQTLNFRPVGGLRIKQVEDKPGIGPSVFKRYRYNRQGDTAHSSGILVNFPDYGYDLSATSYLTNENGEPYNPLSVCFYRVRQSYSSYPLATTQGSYVGYSDVIEDFGEAGESWHSFVAYPDPAPSGFPFAPVESFDWRRGFELGVKDFMKKNNQLVLVREVVNTPFGFDGSRVYGVKTGVNNMLLRNGVPVPQLQPLPKYSFYPTITEFYALGQSKERLYDQNDTTKFVETITDYTYSPQHLQLVQTKTLTSKSDQASVEEIVTNKKYPFDYNFTGVPVGTEAAGIKNLQNLHVTNAVIEEYSFKQNRNLATNQVSNQRVVDGSITTYKNDKPYPDQIMDLELGSPIPLSDYGNGSLLSANTFLKNANVVINGAYKPAVIFNSYDEKGNITTQQKADDIKKSYIWGYHSKYPVAEVIGADMDAIMLISNLDPVILQDSTANDDLVRAELNKVRTKFPGAQVTTFTYKPMVGVSSQTDMNNRTTFYEYDSFGRLVLVRDQDKNILKKFCYNYNGQQGSCAVNTTNP